MNLASEMEEGRLKGIRPKWDRREGLEWRKEPSGEWERNWGRQ